MSEHRYPGLPRTLAWATLGAGVALGAVAARRVRALHVEYHRATAGLTADPGPVVTEADLAALPPVVATYVRASGVVGRPRPRGFCVTMHGRIRAGADAPWMRFRSEQVNTLGPDASRRFLMRARMHGIPVEVLHDFVGDRARMRVRVMGVVPILEHDGATLVRSETVTIVNDLCVFAPAALLDPEIMWTGSDVRHASLEYTRRGITVGATLEFRRDGLLADFVSDDRCREDTPQRWSTPLIGSQEFGIGTLAAAGAGVWHAPAPEGEFPYLELTFDSVVSLTPGATP